MKKLITIINNEKKYYVGWIEDGEWMRYTINPIEPHKRNLPNSSCFPLLSKWLSAKATKLEWTGAFTIELNVTISSRCSNLSVNVKANTNPDVTQQPIVMRSLVTLNLSLTMPHTGCTIMPANAVRDIRYPTCALVRSFLIKYITI